MDYCRQRILTITFLLERYLEIGLEKWTPAARLLSKCAYIMPHKKTEGALSVFLLVN